MAIPTRRLYSIGALAVVATVVGAISAPRLLERQSAAAQGGAFRLEEATIADVHRAIQQAQITCRDLVRAYIERARAYNGVSDRLVTADGAPIPAARGTVRAGAPLQFPTRDGRRVHPAARLSSICGTANRARTDGGDGIGSGRAAAVRHDSRHARRRSDQRARDLNIRGERSVTCKGDRDRHPSQGRCRRARPPCARSSGSSPMRSSAPRSSTRSTASNPDLAAMPMYCIPFSFKDPFDTKDMRSTAAADARYDIDFPARDHTLVAQLRRKGAIIYAKAVNTEYNGIPGDPGGRHEPDKILSPTSAISAAAGRATRTAPTTRRARRRSARARAPARRSAPTS